MSMKVTRPAASLKAAQEAAAKVTAMLVASGQLKPSELHKNKNKSSKSSDLFIEEVVINDAPMSARNFLTRSSTQEEISKMSGAAVSTRGRYMSQDELKNPSKNPSDRPLYLHIQAVNQQDVKVAVGRIMHIIMEHSHRKNQSLQRPRGPRPNPAPGLMGPRPGSGPRGPRPLVFRPPRPDMSAPPPQSHPPPPLTNIFREKVFLPVNIGLNPSEVRARLLGESGLNLRYIQEETGVVISIRGIGSGYLEHATGQEAQDTLHFYLEHDNQEQFNQAKDLVVNLAQTVIGEIQQQQQQQQQPPAPLFTHPPPQQPEVAMGAGGAVGQPHLASVPVAAHQLSAPQAPPPQILHSQMVPPQVSAHSQIVPPHVGPPQMTPTPVPMQSQLGGHTILAPHLQASGGNVSQEVLPQQEVIQGAVVTLAQQVVHLTAPPVVSTAATVPNQQLVHTSSGTQLVTLPPGTQIINTSDGPRLVAIASGTQVTAPVAPVPVSHQSHTVPLHDHQAGPSSIIHQQPPPQTIPVSVTPNHMTINQPPIVSDGTAHSSGIGRQLGVSNSFSTVMSNTVSTTSPHTNVGIHGNQEVTATYPPSVSVTLPPPSTSMAIGVPPPGTGLAIAPGGIPTTSANVCFVLTSGANTLTTTSGVGLLVNQDPSIASTGHMNVSQPLVVAGVLPPAQQHHQQQQVAQATTASSYLGPASNQQLNPSGYPSQSVLEQSANTGYPPPDQSVQAYNPSNPASTTSQSYTQLQSQQPPRVVNVGYVPVNHANTLDGPPPPKIEYPGAGPGTHPGHLPANSLQPQQGPKSDHLASGSPYYSAGGQSDHRPVALEQQWQQFQQQVKVEGGQQQYDPYSAVDDAELHNDSNRQQAPQIAHSTAQQTAVSQTASQQTQAAGQHMQQSFNSFDPSGQQQSSTGGRESEARAPGGGSKEDTKSHGTESPRNSYPFYYGQNQTQKPDTSPERSEHATQALSQNEPRYQNAHGTTHAELPPQTSPNQQQSGSPQTHGQQVVGQVQYQAGQYQSGQYQGMYSQDALQAKNQEDSKPGEHFQQSHQEEHSKLGNINESAYQQGLSPSLIPSSQASTLQGPPPQQQLLTQGPPPDSQYQLDNQYQQGPPPVHPQQNQQYSTAQYTPAGQYPWAQYPQPSSSTGQYPPAPVTPSSIPTSGSFPSAQVPFNGSGAPNTPVPFGIAGSNEACNYPGGNSGPGQYPVGPNGSGNPSTFPVMVGQGEKQQNFQDKKAEPGVARDVTASLLMPPPPPPSSSIPAQSTGVNSRGREESTDRSHKRQRSCSSQDEKMPSGRTGSVSDESASHEDSGSNRSGGSAGSVDSPTSGSFSSPNNFQGGPGNFGAGGGNFMGGPPGPGAFSGGPGYMNPGGPWGWNPMPRPYGGLPVGPNPFNGPPNGPPSGPMGNPQIPYNRGHRGDREHDREEGGGSRRGGRGGGRGGTNVGARWHKFRF